MIQREMVNASGFNTAADLPFELRLKDFELAMQDIIEGESEPAVARKPMTFTEVYLGKVSRDDFRKNARGELGTRTATLHKKGIAKLRANWIYRLPSET